MALPGQESQSRLLTDGEPAAGTAEESSVDESHKERIDRELSELLQGLRVMVTGVQVLFAFLLAMPFQSGFAKVDTSGLWLFFIALTGSATASLCFITPAVQHRLLFRTGLKEKIVHRANELGWPVPFPWRSRSPPRWLWWPRSCSATGSPSCSAPRRRWPPAGCGSCSRSSTCAGRHRPPHHEREHLAVAEPKARSARAFARSHSARWPGHFWSTPLTGMRVRRLSAQGRARPAERGGGVHPGRGAVGRVVAEPLVDEPAQLHGHVQGEMVGAFRPDAGSHQVAHLQQAGIRADSGFELAPQRRQAGQQPAGQDADAVQVGQSAGGRRRRRQVARGW
jgi:hypothetical protein